MKSVILLLLVLLGLTGCSRKNPEQANTPAGKGMELYSWKPTNGDWHFWLLPGTNGTKAGLGLFTPARATVGIDMIKRALSNLPKGERVGWQHLGPSSLPGLVAADITAYCQQVGISIEQTYFEDIKID